MQTQLLTWQISIQRVKPTAAELAATYDRMAHLWSAKTRHLGFDRAYRRLLIDKIDNKEQMIKNKEK